MNQPSSLADSEILTEIADTRLTGETAALSGPFAKLTVVSIRCHLINCCCIGGRDLAGSWAYVVFETRLRAGDDLVLDGTDCSRASRWGASAD